ncbi:C39 family peptidase [Dehalobacter sp. TeCB1]|uniref:C39 family peptidase n=1 Tax=Dehalobacter sp. TeCB1 TaxID=1843715 RepID=UPI00083B7F99|nr:C39 family peptidase [Dehalobacter sp. TeCB1]OCZ51347.1 hypothetical protein A7D23_13065 [Dehalobacter sp. TeCB1]
MAAPIIGIAAKKLIQKIILNLFTDPEKGFRNILLIVLVPLMVVILFFATPIVLAVSVPTILLDSGKNGEIDKVQYELVLTYQAAPDTLNKENLDWIDQAKKEYSWCDDIVVSYSFDLSWQHLIALDSVLLQQDFKKANQADILKMASKFPIRNVTVETYTVQELRTGSYTDKDGNEQEYTYTVEVTKHRAKISITTKPFNTVIKELGFDDFQTKMAQNIYNTIIAADIEGHLNLYDDIDLSQLQEYPPGNANIPYFNQTDKRWGAYSYGKVGTIASSGCGPTSLAMVVAGLTGRSDINPKSVADWSVVNGYRIEGAGSAWALMTAGGANYGLSVEAVSRMNPEAIVQALSKGYPVIVAMGRGHFTSGGHFMVLRGLTEDGKVLINDPVSVKRTNQAWDLAIIMNESSTNGGVNGSPFWIFRP